MVKLPFVGMTIVCVVWPPRVSFCCVRTQGLETKRTGQQAPIDRGSIVPRFGCRGCIGLCGVISSGHEGIGIDTWERGAGLCQSTAGRWRVGWASRRLPEPAYDPAPERQGAFLGARIGIKRNCSGGDWVWDTMIEIERSAAGCCCCCIRPLLQCPNPQRMPERCVRVQPRGVFVVSLAPSFLFFFLFVSFFVVCGRAAPRRLFCFFGPLLCLLCVSICINSPSIVDHSTPSC